MVDVLFEWGAHGLASCLARVGAVVVVDVLSFSTCVDVATSRGALIYPAPLPGVDAVRAGRRGSGTYSLSPASFLGCKPGERVVLPSPNGGALALACGDRPVLTACLRNATAVALAAAAGGRPVAIIAAGERWPDRSLRPALEDLLGAGAVIRAMPGSRSPEAAAAVAAFEALSAELLAAISGTPSGRELIERGHAGDVELAAELDVSRSVPRLRDGAFHDDGGPRATAPLRTRTRAVPGHVTISHAPAASPQRLEPELSVREAILLLALDERAGTVIFGTPLAAALGGAILVDLQLQGMVQCDDSVRGGMVRALDSGRTGSRLLDECHDTVRRAPRQASVSIWLGRFMRIPEVKHRVAEELCARGILRRETGRVLRVFRRELYPEVDPGPERRLRERIVEAVESAARDVAPATLSVVALALHAGLLRHVVEPKSLRAHRARLARLGKDDVVADAVGVAIRAANDLVVAMS